MKQKDWIYLQNHFRSLSQNRTIYLYKSIHLGNASGPQLFVSEHD